MLKWGNIYRKNAEAEAWKGGNGLGKFICSNEETVAVTAQGKIRGYLYEGVYAFQGIKYADAQRFQMPKETESWEGVKDALAYGYVCPLLNQDEPFEDVRAPHRYWPMDENCQYLNIWTKSLDADAAKPVMVWLHGGGFAAGSSIEQIAYEGDHLAQAEDVVVVSLNHRLNILGYLDLSAYGEKYANSGNAGNADIVMATDPDADRLGIYALDTKSGEYVPFTGNMSGMLIAEYILRERAATGTMPENPAMVKTIVTTNMADPIAADYGVKLIEVLTGFKYIGEQIKLFEQTGSNNYVFGLEESYGCLAGTHARDKDAVVAVMCLCEVAAWCKKHGKTLWDQMLALYEKYGYYKEDLYTITLKGIDGSRQIAEMMDKLRKNPPTRFGDLDVVRVRDYATGIMKELATGKEEPTGLPESNVLYFDLTNDSWCCARPSGTEPKIKFYMGVKGDSLEDAKAKNEKLTEELKAVIGQ